MDFPTVSTYLTAVSACLANQVQNGTVSKSFGTLTLNGSSVPAGTLVVFNLTATDVQNVSSWVINFNNANTVLINVAGTGHLIQNAGFTINNNANAQDRTKVLFNFYQAISMTIQNIGFQGTVLAPLATLSFQNGNYGLAGDTPICGDWDGDATDTPGAWRNGVWYLRNSNSAGPPDITFQYSPVPGVRLIWR